MSEIPRDLDWVKEKAACSLAKVFKEIQAGVEQDIKNMNASLQGKDFGISPESTGFVVHHLNLSKSVLFYPESDHIRIMNQVTNEDYRVTLTLNVEGRCKLLIAGDELEQWQVRRKALEALFFSAHRPA